MVRGGEFVSCAKALPANRSEKGDGDENGDAHKNWSGAWNWSKLQEWETHVVLGNSGWKFWSNFPDVP